MATKVAANVLNELSSPLLSPDIFSAMMSGLATADEQADHHANTCGDADGLPRIFMHINVGRLGCRFGSDQQLRLRIRHRAWQPLRDSPLGSHRRPASRRLVGRGFSKAFGVDYCHL